MKPIEVVVSLLPMLTDAEKQVVREQLQFTPCSKQGHNFKVVKLPAKSFWEDSTVQMVCTRCGKTQRV